MEPSRPDEEQRRGEYRQQQGEFLYESHDHQRRATAGTLEEWDGRPHASAERSTGVWSGASAGHVAVQPVHHHHHYYFAPSSHPPLPTSAHPYSHQFQLPAMTYQHSLSTPVGLPHASVGHHHQHPLHASHHVTSPGSTPPVSTGAPAGTYFAPPHPVQPTDWSQPLPPIRLHPPAGPPPLSAHHRAEPYAQYAQHSPPPPGPGHVQDRVITHVYDEHSRWIASQDHHHVSNTSPQLPPPPPAHGFAQAHGHPPPSAESPHADHDPDQLDERIKFENSVQALQSLAQGGSGRHAKREFVGSHEHGETAAHAAVDLVNGRQRAESSASARAGDGGSASSAASWRAPSASAQQHTSSDDELAGGPVAGPDGKVNKKRKRRRKATEEPRDMASRKFACVTCNKMFARPSALATHERSHSKEKPHACPVGTCRRAFAVPSNLRRHQRVYGHFETDEEQLPEAGPSSSKTSSASSSNTGAAQEAEASHQGSTSATSYSHGLHSPPVGTQLKLPPEGRDQRLPAQSLTPPPPPPPPSTGLSWTG